MGRWLERDLLTSLLVWLLALPMSNSPRCPLGSSLFSISRNRRCSSTSHRRLGSQSEACFSARIGCRFNISSVRAVQSILYEYASRVDFRLEGLGPAPFFFTVSRNLCICSSLRLLVQKYASSMVPSAISTVIFPGLVLPVLPRLCMSRISDGTASKNTT